MNPILSLLRAEIEMRGPVLDVRVSCNRRPHSPLAVVIRWRGMSRVHVPRHELESGNAKVSGAVRSPDVCRRLIIQWEHPSDVEALCSEAGWSLGGGYLDRWFFAPAIDRAASRIGVVAAFGGCPYTTHLGDMSIGDDCSDQVDAALAHGHWSWQFNTCYGILMLDSSSIDRKIMSRWSDEPGEGSPRDPDGCRSRPFPGWRRTLIEDIAETFETIDEPDAACLRIPRRYDRLRADDKMR